MSATTLSSSLWKITAPIKCGDTSRSSVQHTRHPFHKKNFLKPSSTELWVARRKCAKKIISLASENDQLTTEATADSPEDVAKTKSTDVVGVNGNPLVVEESSSVQKRAPLTAREKLRAARVLSKYNEPKRSKSEFGSKVLDALKENDKGKKKKRSGLPEAPTNMFDDSNRGLSKGAWSFEFLPVGTDALVVVASFVLISITMFATTYLVWKVGAIHFNEY